MELLPNSKIITFDYQSISGLKNYAHNCRVSSCLLYLMTDSSPRRQDVNRSLRYVPLF